MRVLPLCVSVCHVRTPNPKTKRRKKNKSGIRLAIFGVQIRVIYCMCLFRSVFGYYRYYKDFNVCLII